MSNIDSLPPNIQDLIKGLKDPSNSEQIKFNYAQSIERIKEACDFALKQYRK